MTDKNRKIRLGITGADFSIEGDIQTLKIVSEAVSEYLTKHGLDYRLLTDTCFEIDSRYQRYHNLDIDNWDFIELDREELGLN